MPIKTNRVLAKNTLAPLNQAKELPFSKENFDLLIADNARLKKEIREAYNLKHHYQDQYIQLLESFQEQNPPVLEAIMRVAV